MCIILHSSIYYTYSLGDSRSVAKPVNVKFIDSSECVHCKCFSSKSIRSELTEVKTVLSNLVNKNNELVALITKLTVRLETTKSSSSSTEHSKALADKLSYSEAVKKVPVAPVVILKPRDVSQSRNVTIQGVNKKLDSSCIGINNIRNAVMVKLLLNANRMKILGSSKKLLSKYLVKLMTKTNRLLVYQC